MWCSKHTCARARIHTPPYLSLGANVARNAAAASARPAPHLAVLQSESTKGLADSLMIVFIAAAVSDGCSASISAASPEMCAVACDVPLEAA